MRFGKMLVAAAVASMGASAAQAAVTAEWVEVPITVTTDSSGANIAGYQSWDLMITLTPGDDFLSSRILFDPEGPLFFHSGNANPAAPPNSVFLPVFPALEFTSYLQGPSQTPPPGSPVNVVGSTDGTNDLPPPAVFSEDRVAVAFGDLTTNDAGGTFRLARFTFGGPDIQPTGVAMGRIYSLQDQNEGIAIPEHPAFIIPEPGTLGLVAAAGLLAIRRRK